MKLGDRKVYLRSSQGDEEVVTLTVRLDLTHGEPWVDDPTNITGTVELSGDGWTTTVNVYAVDEIQAVGRLVKLAGATLLGACERDGRALWTPDRAEAVTDPLQIF